MPGSPVVYVIDDDPAVCKTLREILRTVGLSVTPYTSAVEFLEGFDQDQPGCIVCDLRMPGIGGLELQRELADRKSDTPMIFITGHAEVSVAVEALKQGAFDFLEKPFSAHHLIEAVRQAIVEDGHRRAGRARRTALSGRLSTLTPREREVLEHVVAGRSSRVIAEELGLTEKTVELHRSRVNKKMAVRNAVELVRLIEEGGTGKP